MHFPRAPASSPPSSLDRYTSALSPLFHFIFIHSIYHHSSFLLLCIHKLHDVKNFCLFMMYLHCIKQSLAHNRPWQNTCHHLRVALLKVSHFELYCPSSVPSSLPREGSGLSVATIPTQKFKRGPHPLSIQKVGRDGFSLRTQLKLLSSQRWLQWFSHYKMQRSFLWASFPGVYCFGHYWSALRGAPYYS